MPTMGFSAKELTYLIPALRHCEAKLMDAWRGEDEEIAADAALIFIQALFGTHETSVSQMTGSMRNMQKMMISGSRDVPERL